MGEVASLAGMAGPLPAPSQGQRTPVTAAAPKGDGELAATRRYRVKLSETGRHHTRAIGGAQMRPRRYGICCRIRLR